MANKEEPRSTNGTAALSGKIIDLDLLGEALAPLRNNGSKIAHCHGVFDLLHLGHIRHFQEAKKMGEVLVVTLTPDQYVNKGPNRPAFGEGHRAESIAALDCVDFVAVNKWPTAEQTIKIVKPDFYVKGADYREASDDRTGGIILEEEAVRSVGGQIAFTDDITFSSSNLINQHLPVLPQEVMDYLAEFSSRHGKDEVLGYLDGADPLKVLVVGEAIIDEYVYCQSIGKSSKDPMLAVQRLSTEKFAGGILSVGNHVSNYAGQVSVVSLLGTEDSHEEFIADQLNGNVNTTWAWRKNAPTILKRRFVDNYSFTKLFEVYEMDDQPLQVKEDKALCAILAEQVPQHDVVIVVDFGHGMLSNNAIDILCSRSKFLAVNTQSNAGNLGYHTISRYPRADFACLAEPELRLEARDRRGDLEAMLMDVSKKLSCSRVMVTRGKNGCLGYDSEAGFFPAPAVADRVIDRMGAGDAFLSITALCVAQGAPMEVVGFIGNAVGAQAVATVGNRESVGRLPLSRHIEALLK